MFLLDYSCFGILEGFPGLQPDNQEADGLH